MITAAAHASSAIQWGDFPTWALAVIALLALIAAAAAYFRQADAAKKLAEQVTIQHDQLKDQQEANRKQAEVLDAQLREMKQRERVIERQQADAVKLSLTEWGGELPGYSEETAPLRMALVENDSHRPIRDVACRLYTVQDDKLWEPVAWAPANEGADGRSLEDSAVLEYRDDPTKIQLILAYDAVAFIFNLIVNPDLEERLTLRFTDDAGLHWQIDPDLSLTKLDSRKW